MAMLCRKEKENSETIMESLKWRISAFFRNISPCTFISYCTSIRYTRVSRGLASEIHLPTFLLLIKKSYLTLNVYVLEQILWLKRSVYCVYKRYTIFYENGESTYTKIVAELCVSETILARKMLCIPFSYVKQHNHNFYFCGPIFPKKAHLLHWKRHQLSAGKKT